MKEVHSRRGAVARRKTKNTLELGWHVLNRACRNATKCFIMQLRIVFATSLTQLNDHDESSCDSVTQPIFQIGWATLSNGVPEAQATIKSEKNRCQAHASESMASGHFYFQPKHGTGPAPLLQ